MGKMSPAKRSNAYKRSGGKCWFCGLKPAEDVEHLIPKARGGTDEDKNLVGACDPCNSAKAGHGISGNPNWTLEEFREVGAERLGLSPAEVVFYGERLDAARRAILDQHDQSLHLSIIYGRRDDLIVLPEGFKVPYQPLHDDDDDDF